MLAEMSEAWRHVSVERTDGYVVELARRLGARYLVRGVRGATDIESELALSRLNSQLAPEIETVFVPARAGLADVSSSRLKQLARDGADLSAYCYPAVRRRLEQWAQALPAGVKDPSHAV